MIIQRQLQLDDNEILNLIERGGEWKNSRVVNTNYNNKRKSQDITIPLTNDSFLLDKLKPLGIKSLPSFCKVIRYREGDKFDKHKDTGEQYQERFKTLVIQLSTPEEYTGGQLRVYYNDTSIEANKSKYNCIMFPSNLMHEARAIESGERICLIMWLTKDMMGVSRTII